MTSNIGSQWLSDALLDAKEIQQKVMEAVQTHFPPEFLNRIDDLIIFDRLGVEELKRIVTLELTQLSHRFAEKEMTLTLSESAKAELVETRIRSSLRCASTPTNTPTGHPQSIGDPDAGRCLP